MIAGEAGVDSRGWTRDEGSAEGRNVEGSACAPDLVGGRRAALPFGKVRRPRTSSPDYSPHLQHNISRISAIFAAAAARACPPPPTRASTVTGTSGWRPHPLLQRATCDYGEVMPKASACTCPTIPCRRPALPAPGLTPPARPSLQSPAQSRPPPHPSPAHAFVRAKELGCTTPPAPATPAPLGRLLATHAVPQWRIFRTGTLVCYRRRRLYRLSRLPARRARCPHLPLPIQSPSTPPCPAGRLRAQVLRPVVNEILDELVRGEADADRGSDLS